jgi:hypothetical protein
MLEETREFHETQLESIRVMKAQSEQSITFLDRRMNEYIAEKEALIAKEHEVRLREIEVERLKDELGQKHVELTKREEDMRAAQAKCDIDVEDAAKAKEECARESRQLEEDRHEFEQQKEEWETSPTGPRPRCNERVWLDHEEKRLVDDRQRLADDRKEFTAAQIAFEERLLTFLDEKQTMTEQEHQA